jgi:WD40 repeat protein
MRFHHLRPELLFSSSKDFSIRLWNANTGELVVVFGGDGGHRESVLGIVGIYIYELLSFV